MDAQVIHELAAIRSLVTVVVWVAVGIVIVLVANVVVNYRTNVRNLETGEFFARGNALLMKGDLEELLGRCEKHLAKFPSDASADWLKGTAHYRRKEWNEALLCYRKADQLQPGFAIGPSISEIEEKIASARVSPDLRVVPPVTPMQPSPMSKEGPPKDVDA